jgi:hypothetical protein
MELLNSFVDESKKLGLNPVVDNVKKFVNIEFNYDDELWNAWRKLLNKYVGFWKSIACHHDHDKEKRIARFRVPFHLITGKDISTDQLLAVADRISKKL